MTLYQRLEVVCSENSITFPSISDRVKIGVEVSNYFPETHKILTKEERFKFMVNVYSPDQYPGIDYIILKTLKN